MENRILRINFHNLALKKINFSFTFGRQKKLTEVWPFFQKKSDNYTNGGIVRESPFHLQIHSVLKLS